MATWAEMSREGLQAAGVSMRAECYRSAVSRSYFAAFAALVHSLELHRVSFPDGWHGPSHQNVPELVRKNLKGLTRARRKRVLAAIRQLYESRLDADYRPPRTVGRSAAIISVSSASFIIELMGVPR